MANLEDMSSHQVNAHVESHGNRKKNLVEMDSRALVRRASRACHRPEVTSRRDHLFLLS